MDTCKIASGLGVFAHSHNEESSLAKEEILINFLADYLTKFMAREAKKRTEIRSSAELKTGEAQEEKYFHALSLPSVSLRDYIERLLIYGVAQKDFLSIETTLFGMLIYMERFLNVTGVLLSPYNVNRLMLVGLCLINKMGDDKPFNNTYMAEVGGITNNELNKLEIIFFQAIDYNLYISGEEYKNYQKNIANSIPTKTKARLYDLKTSVSG